MRRAAVLQFMLVVAPLGCAVAQDSSGSIDVRYYARVAPHAAPLESPGGVSIVSNEVELFFDVVDPRSPFGSSTGRCLAFGIVGPGPSDLDEFGRCTVTTANSDKIFFEFDFDRPELGRARILGGDGRFAQMNGKFDMTSEPLPALDPSGSAWTGMMSGTYTLSN